MRHFAAIAAGILTALFLSGAACAQAPSQDALTAAKELVTAAGSTEKFKALLPLLSQQLKPLVAQGRPEVERDYDKIMPLIVDAANTRVSQILDAIAEIYARNFTVDEMHQLAAFYRTPAGRKFLEKIPVVTQQSMEVGNRFGQEIVRDLQARITDELRKRGHNI